MLSDLRRLAPDLRRERGATARLVLLLLVALPPGVAAPLLVRRLFDEALPAGDAAALAGLTAAVLGLTLVGSGAVWLQGLAGIAQRSRIRQRVTGRVVRHLLRLPASFFQRTDTGYLVSRVREDVAALDGLMPDALAAAAVDLLRALVFLGVLLFLDPVLALCGLAVVGLLSGGMALSSAWMRRLSATALEREAASGAALHDAVAGLLAVRLAARERDERRQVGRLTAAALRSRARRDGVGRGLGAGLGAAGLAGVYAVLAIGAWRVMTGASTVGTLLSFFLVLTQLVAAADELVALNPQWQRALAAAARLGEILDEPAEEASRVRPAAAPLRGELTFDGVSLRYGDGPPVLDGVSLAARPGEVVAVVGPSGAGKTSLLRLIPRLFAPSAGRLLIDGRPIEEVPLETLRRAVGFVPQEVFLFNRSVRDNIALAVPAASEAAVRRAARLAAADDFIRRLPAGYATLVGERGARLSGGQRQRLGIAREVLRDTPILLLDEATASLDGESEARWQRALARLKAGRTCLVVAHRLSTVLAADRIVLLADGRVRATGTHDELFASSPLYRRLCEHQLVAPPAPPPPRRAPARAVSE